MNELEGKVSEELADKPEHKAFYREELSGINTSFVSAELAPIRKA